MQVSFSAPSLAPSSFAAATPADPSIGTPAAGADSFASFLDSQSERAPLPAATIPSGQAPAAEEPVVEANPFGATKEDIGEDTDTETSSPDTEDPSADWGQLAEVVAGVGQRALTPAPLAVPSWSAPDGPAATVPEDDECSLGVLDDSPLGGAPAKTAGAATAGAHAPVSESSVPALPVPCLRRPARAIGLVDPLPSASSTPVVAAAAPEVPASGTDGQRAPGAPMVPAAPGHQPVPSAPVVQQPQAAEVGAANVSDTPVAAVSASPALPVPMPSSVMNGQRRALGVAPGAPSAPASPAVVVARPEIASSGPAPVEVLPDPLSNSQPSSVSTDAPTPSAVATSPRGRVATPLRVTDQARAIGAQLIMQNAATTETSSSPASVPATPGASPIVSMPTLAQMLVETAAVNLPQSLQPNSGKAPAGRTVLAEAVPQPVAAPGVSIPPAPVNVTGPAVPTVSTVPSALVLVDAVPGPAPERASAPANGEIVASVVTEDGQPAETPVRGLREILAASTGKPGRREALTRKEGAVQNFQTVEKQRVGGQAMDIGTRIANKTQTMTAPAPVQLPADAALDTFELPSAPAQAVSTTSGTTALKPTAEVGVPRSFAAAAVREVMDVAEKAQATGRTHVELRLETKDNESLRIHLNWREGVVHAKFVTQTSELQRALSREWDQVAPRLAEQGLRFSEPSFERNGQQPDQQPGHPTFSSDQQRQHSRGRNADADDLPEFALPGAALKTAAVSTRQVATRTSATPSPALADARGLRVWA